MYGDVEELVLSGKLFNRSSPSSSPTRSRSESPTNGYRWPTVKSDYEDDPGDNQGSDDHEDVLDELENTSNFPKTKNGNGGNGSIGMEPGRTGVKGVIRDRREVEGLEREARKERMREINERMGRMDLGGMTFLEEEEYDRRVKQNEEEEAERRGERDWEERRKALVEMRSGRFGHLREVGVGNFVSAIEKEGSGVWVVVHIYDQRLERCARLDNELSLLARDYPSVKFVRTRAGALGFATPSSSSTPQHGTFSSNSAPSHSSHSFDEDEYYADDDEEETGYLPSKEHAVDTDMLPTMLVYRNGELEFNWVRVDWVIRDELGAGTGEEGVGARELLERYGILKRNQNVSSDPRASFGNKETSASGSEESLEIEFEHELDY